MHLDLDELEVRQLLSVTRTEQERRDRRIRRGIPDGRPVALDSRAVAMLETIRRKLEDALHRGNGTPAA